MVLILTHVSKTHIHKVFSVVTPPKIDKIDFSETCLTFNPDVSLRPKTLVIREMQQLYPNFEHTFQTWMETKRKFLNLDGVEFPDDYHPPQYEIGLSNSNTIFLSGTTIFIAGKWTNDLLVFFAFEHFLCQI